MFPFDGKIYNSFAGLSHKEEDILATVYFLMRALACNMPHEAAREFLIDFFEELRLKYVNLTNQLKSKKTQVEDKKLQQFLLCHFRI